MNKKDFDKLTVLSNSTVYKLSKDENITMAVFEKICRNLNCLISNILEFNEDVG